jgi:UDP-glucose 4-epimerase
VDVRVLVTGATGFLGKQLVRILLARGHHVFVAQRDKASCYREAQLLSGADRIFLDLSQPFDTTQLPLVDVVVTLAQERDFRNFPDMASRTLSVNVTSNVQLWEWASRTGVKKLIHASSGGIYGSGTGLAFTEDTLPPPHAQNSFYLGTKLCSEIAVRSFMPLFESVIIIRPFFLYGPGQDADKFVQRLIENVADDRPIMLNHPDGLRTNPIFVDDAANVFADALTQPGSYTVNCAGKETVTLRDLCDRIGHRLAKKPRYTLLDEPASDCIGDTNLQFEKFQPPRTDINTGLDLTIAGSSRLHD